jgi:hypothetical protein
VTVAHWDEVESHHRAKGEMEHTFVAGSDGLEFLVFGTCHPTELGWLPRSRAIRLGRPWVDHLEYDDGEPLEDD